MLLFAPPAHADEVETIQWSPTGEEVLARIWSDRRGESATWLLRAHPETAVAIAIPGDDAGFDWVGPDTVLLSGGMGTTLANLADRSVQPLLDRGYPRVRMNPARTMMATWTPEKGTELWVPERCTPKIGTTTCTPRRWIHAKDTPEIAAPVCWLADGGLLTARTTPEGTHLTHYGPDLVVRGAVPLPAGPVVVDVARDGTYVVWQDARSSAWVVRGRVEGGTLIAPIPLPGVGPASAVDLAEDGSALVIGTPSGDVQVWWTDGAGPATSTPGHVRVRAVAISGDGTTVAADGDGEVVFWSPTRPAPTPP